MIIGQIKDGIVLDHITAGRGMEIYKILELDKLNCTVAMIERAVSPKMGRKDIIKLDQIIDLDFDVLGMLQEFLNENIIVAEGFFGFRGNKVESGNNFLFLITSSHTASAAAGSSFQHNGETVLLGEAESFFSVF